MQGRLLGRNVAIASRCAACAAPIRIEIDEELGWRAPGAALESPLVFEPAVDWSRFAEPNILHAY